jgi:PD-(D/E)XK nuclease superfamily
LRIELEQIEKGDAVKIIALEERFERMLEHPKLPYPVKIGGSVDRIEQRNGKIRIIDYKTGKVEAKDISLKQWAKLTSDIKNDKIIQVLAYAFMYAPNVQNQEMEVGIISFKNLKSGFLPFNFKIDKTEISVISEDISSNYIEQLVLLLNEILDPNIPFEEKI